MSELLPCPFCGNYKGDENNDAPHICFSVLRDAELAHCEVCGAEVHAHGKDPRATWNTRPIEDGLRAELARRDEIITRLKEDGERLASTYVIEVFPHEWVCRGGCHHWARFGEQIEHSPGCPITLHRALMKELE